jgi:hypothetical protein
MAIIRQSLTETANTFSQNQTLNGTANTAPNQTEASASSLMTRSLAGTEPFFNLGACYRPASLAFGNTGAGSMAMSAILPGTNSLASIASGTTATGYGRATLGQGLSTYSTYSGGGIGFGGRRIGVATRFFIGIRSPNNLIRLIVGGNGAVPPTADQNALSNNGFGWESRFTGTNEHEVRLFAHNGTTYSTSSWQSLSTATVSGDWLYNAVYISVVSNGAGLITCFHGLNGNRNLSSFTLSGGPIGNAPNPTSYVDLVCVNGATPANGWSIGLTDAMFITNL